MLITIRFSKLLSWCVLFCVMGIAAGAIAGYRAEAVLAARWKTEADQANAAVIEARKQIAVSQALVARANREIAELQGQETRDERPPTSRPWDRWYVGFFAGVMVYLTWWGLRKKFGVSQLPSSQFRTMKLRTPNSELEVDPEEEARIWRELKRAE